MQQSSAAAEHAAGNGAATTEAAPAPRAGPRPVLAASSWEAVSRSAPEFFPRSSPAPVPNRLRVFSGTSNPSLAQEVACYLGMDLGKIKVKRFADGEIYVQVRARRLGRGAAGSVKGTGEGRRQGRCMHGGAGGRSFRLGPMGLGRRRPRMGVFAWGPVHATPHAGQARNGRRPLCALCAPCAQVLESIRGCDVFLIQPTSPPVNDHLMELLVMIDACRRASARSVTAVMPYFGYARADRKTQVRAAGRAGGWEGWVGGWGG